MAISIRGSLKRAIRDFTDPVVCFPAVDNLEKLASARGWSFEEILPASIQVCPGAKAMSEDFLAWVDRGQSMLRMHRDAGRGPEFGRHWASHLHSVYRYPMDRVFRCAIPGAFVLSHGGGVLSPEKEVLNEAFFISNLLRKSEIPDPWPRPMEGRFISLLTIWGERNLSHFYFDALLRTTLFQDLSGFRFLVPKDLQPWHVGLLRVAGIRPEQIVRVKDGVTVVEELHICHISRAGCLPRRELLGEFRRRARKAANVSEKEKPFRRLFVDRSGAKHRKLANQKELEKVLSARGFELVRWEDHSMEDQIRLASETTILAGPHGTSLLNSIYCAPGAKLLEIVNSLWWDAATLRQSTLMGHEFWYCFGENASSDYDTKISPDKLARVLDYMLDGEVFEIPPEVTGRPVKTF